MKNLPVIDIFITAESFLELYRECAPKRTGTRILFDETPDGLVFFASPRIVARESFYIPFADIEEAKKQLLDTVAEGVTISVKTERNEEDDDSENYTDAIN